MSCTIIVSHYESLPFLRTCIRQLRKYRNDKVEQHIIIADQSSFETSKIVLEEFTGEDITICKMQPLYSGYGIDWVIRNVDIKTEYICQLHVDAFPISDKWLTTSIQLMRENDFKFTGILQFICDKPEAIYPFKNPFFAMAQSFHVGRTDVYKEMSLHAGFTRFHNRLSTDFTWLNDDWDKWASEDYQRRGSDDDVVAFYWEDTYREHNKMGLGMTAKIGGKGESGYGSITEDMVFHFGFCRESLGVMDQMGENYRRWTKRINAGFTDELIEDMLIEARKNPIDPKNGRIVWDGKLKTTSSPTKELNEKIEKLKI